jgi:choline dehydrogenase-like flavoprotein
MANTRLIRLEADNRRVHTAIVEQDGQQQRLSAKVFVLAAGALATPDILRRSELANRSGLVGRRLMRHAIDLFVLTLAPRLGHAGESKELGLNDHYGGPGAILGTVQSFGMPPPLAYLRNQPGTNLWKALGPVATVIHRLFAHAPIVASILADSADVENRVEARRIRYRLPAADADRRRHLRERVRKSFRGFGPVGVFGTEDRQALGHVCGTAVSGDDGAKSVLTAMNRAHDVENLYVVDASFFPTSGAVNPALTVMANALRVADHVHREVL